MCSLIALILAFFVYVSPTPHAFYVSVIEIDVRDESTEVRVKVFSDDLQAALRNAFGETAIGEMDQLCADHLQDIGNYFETHLRLEMNDQLLRLEAAKCEQLTDAHWLTFEAASSATAQLSIQADFFMELFPTQTQMVHIANGDQRRTLRLTKKEMRKEVSF